MTVQLGKNGTKTRAKTRAFAKTGRRRLPTCIRDSVKKNFTVKRVNFFEGTLTGRFVVIVKAPPFFPYQKTNGAAKSLGLYHLWLLLAAQSIGSCCLSVGPSKPLSQQFLSYFFSPRKQFQLKIHYFCEKLKFLCS